MTKAQGEKLRSIYAIVLSIFSIFVGVLFIVQTWSIYRSAPQSPYTVENIAKHFKQIALPVWLWVAAVFGNMLLAILFPEKAGCPKAYIDTAISLDKTKKQMAADAELLQKTSAVQKKEEKFRTLVCVVCLGFVLAMIVFGCLILFGVLYQTLVNTAFFTAHNSVVDKLVQCMVVMAFALAFVCVCVILNDNSRKRERAYYQQERVKALLAKKEAQASGAVLPTAKQIVTKKHENTLPKKQENSKTMGVWYVRGAIFAVAIVLVIVGVVNGGMREVFVKAINICTQCIGLG